MKRRGSVQTVHIGWEGITDDVVHLTADRYRAVLEVGSVNFALQGEVEQEATVAGFAAFLNGLSFPVQILVRAMPIDVAAQLAVLERQARGLSEPLADLARDHIAFLRRLARSRTLLERRFYLIVPAQEDSSPGRPGWPFRKKVPGATADTARKQLTFRCEEIERQLGRCGLRARRLGNVELAQLFHACLCPELSRTQRLQRDLTDYTTLAVWASESKRRRT